MILTSPFHKPVLLTQLIESLEIVKGKKYIDATLGGGGYTDEILKLGGIVLGIDQDQNAIEYVSEKSRGKSSKFKIGKELFLVHGNFANIREIARENEFDKVAGIVFDLGMSTYQLERSGRGFSHKGNERLDMRMDTDSILTAGEIINTYSKERLYEIFTKYAEELHSGTISEAIVRARSIKDITGTGELSQIIDKVLDRIDSKDNQFNKDRLYQATKARIFQALRLEVNDELENLECGLAGAIELLAPGGKIAVISFHSLEDRIVKLTFKKAKESGILKIVNADLFRADREERRANSKAKSAKLRIAEKIM